MLAVALTAASIVLSWCLTGKWWKIPSVFAIPLMLYRLWSTWGDSRKLAEASASVDLRCALRVFRGPTRARHHPGAEDWSVASMHSSATPCVSVFSWVCLGASSEEVRSWGDRGGGRSI